MHKLFTSFTLCLFAISLQAQTQTVIQKASPIIPETQPYGKVNIEDLELKSCDFEKEANSEVLFDKGTIFQDGNVSILERHVRIKVFNDFGKYQANVRLEYISFRGATNINHLEAETINLVNGKQEFTQLDKKAIYSETVDKIHSALVFAMPNVIAGSIIEVKYRVLLEDGYFPNWYFQSAVPTRYSEIKTDFPGGSMFRVIPHVKQAYAKNIGKGDDYTQLKALANIHSLPNEPFIGSRLDNLERMEYLSQSTRFNTWEKIGIFSTRAGDYGQQLDRNVSGESEIIKHAKDLKTTNEKIAFIFDTVKNHMKWNDISHFYTTDGTVRAWDKKTGNSAEINMILYHLLKKAGVNAYTMIVSAKENGKLNPANPNFYLFNSVVVFIPVDSTKHYVLDATNKFNLFNQVPTSELNTFGLNIDEANRDYQPVFLENELPAMQSVFLNAEIKPDGKMSGMAEVNNYSYNKINATKKYKTDGEEKFIKYLRNDDNNIKVSSLKMENMEVDTLPLTQKFDFGMELTGSDGNYIYFNTNLFTQMGENPFKREERYSDIDFGYRNNCSINGIYKLPNGYKTDALPKSVTIVMPDESIIFKRIVAEDNGTILVKYVLNHKKTLYFREDYQDIRGFYKKMYDLMNEQIVLKKI